MAVTAQVRAPEVDATIAELKRLYGDRVTTAHAVREQHGKDISYHEAHLPDAVVFAESVEEVQAIKKYLPLRIDTGFAAVPARYVLERAAWREAAVLQPRASQFAITEAIGYFTRAMGAARTGQVNRAREDVMELERLSEADRAKGQEYWAGQIKILIRAALAEATASFTSSAFDAGNIPISSVVFAGLRFS